MTRNRLFEATLAAFAAVTILWVPALAQTPTVKSLAATHGTIVAGDLTFSNFQAPAALPYTFFGPLMPNDGSDIAVSATTMASGRVGLLFTAIDPASGSPKPWVISFAAVAGGGGGKGGGGGGTVTLPTDVSRVVTYDVTVTNPNLLLNSTDVSYGPGTATTGVGAWEAMTYYVEPVTSAPHLQIWDIYAGNSDSKSSNFNTINQSLGGRIALPLYGAATPGGYQRSLRHGVQIMMGAYLSLGTGTATLDSYGVGYTTVPANTPPVTPPATLVFFYLQPAGIPPYGVIMLSGPAAMNTDITLTSSAPNALNLPPTITVPPASQGLNVPISFGQVAVDTAVTVTASLNGQTFTANIVVPAAKPLALATVAVPSVFAGSVAGGSAVQGSVAMTSVVQGSPVTVQLASNDPAVSVPASVTVPAGAAYATFAVTTSSVTIARSVTVTATYNGASVSSQIWLIPSVTITSARYLTLSQKFFITAMTGVANAVLTFAVDDGSSLGTMSFSAWVWTGHANMRTTPTTATVWSSAGGMATVPVTLVNQ